MPNEPREKFKIVAVDSYVTDFDGLGWEDFRDLGDFIKFDRTTPEQLIERIAQADAVLTNKVTISSAVMDSLPRLRYIGAFATGVDRIDLQHARSKGIAVTNVPAYSTDSVAQHTMAFILNYASKISEYDKLVKAGQWHSGNDFCFFSQPLTELNGKILGIVGYGAIGRKVEQIAASLGMKVIIAAIPGRSYDKKEPHQDLSTALKTADYISLHCPLTELTKKLINAERLSLMKKNAVLINTARGGLVDEPALEKALMDRQIAHACLDVMAQEPPAADNALQYSEHVTITPHIAWGSRAARERLVKEAADNLRAFLEGKERNRVEL